MANPVRYILVHGSCHGAWCWRDVLPKLENATAIDLPSHGKDTTPISEVTLETYVNAIISEINKGDEPVVLVGHSAAGIAISSVAERIPERISHLIYLCAYAPKNGDALNLIRKRAKRQLVMPAVVMSEDGLSYTIDPSKAPAYFIMIARQQRLILPWHILVRSQFCRNKHRSVSALNTRPFPAVIFCAKMIILFRRKNRKESWLIGLKRMCIDWHAGIRHFLASRKHSLKYWAI